MKEIVDCESFVFDLDRTLFDTYDSHGSPIWAKQLIPPYRLDAKFGSIIDDVGSVCTLRKGVREFLEYLSVHRKSISFLSVGAIKGNPPKYQPSLGVLETFDILKFFNKERILLHRDCKKSDHFPFTEGVLFAFFDDSAEHLADVISKYPSVIAVDSSDKNSLLKVLQEVELSPSQEVLVEH